MLATRKQQLVKLEETGGKVVDQECGSSHESG